MSRQSRNAPVPGPMRYFPRRFSLHPGSLHASGRYYKGLSVLGNQCDRPKGDNGTKILACPCIAALQEAAGSESVLKGLARHSCYPCRARQSTPGQTVRPLRVVHRWVTPGPGTADSSREGHVGRARGFSDRKAAKTASPDQARPIPWRRSCQRLGRANQPACGLATIFSM
jgi:hypothetical protein